MQKNIVGVGCDYSIESHQKKPTFLLKDSESNLRKSEYFPTIFTENFSLNYGRSSPSLQKKCKLEIKWFCFICYPFSLYS